MNIAVVDDEEINRKQKHGFIKKQKPESEISDFSTGEGLLAAKADFDIIFLDIQMEGMGGIEAGANPPAAECGCGAGLYHRHKGLCV